MEKEDQRQAWRTGRVADCRETPCDTIREGTQSEERVNCRLDYISETRKVMASCAVPIMDS